MGPKGANKKHNDVDYELLYNFFQRYFAVPELWDVKDAFSTYYVLKGFILVVSTVYAGTMRVKRTPETDGTFLCTMSVKRSIQ